MLQFLEGDKMGPTVYYVDVRANPAGWNIFLKRGATIESPTVLHITKGIRLLWDKGTPVRIEVSPPQNQPHQEKKTGGKERKRLHLLAPIQREAKYDTGLPRNHRQQLA